MDGTIHIISDTRVSSCIECGKCTGNCPITRVKPDYSPRINLTRMMQGNLEDLCNDPRIWECLTCGMCNQRCPQDVKYSLFVQKVRTLPDTRKPDGICSHGGAFQSLMKIMTANDLKQNRTEWITKDLKIAKKSKVLYFVGCLPYFDAFFSDIGVNSLEIARSTVKLLNAAGVEPMVMDQERCCGHDLFWAGDMEPFQRLADQNARMIRESGAETVVTACAECFRTLKQDYPGFTGSLGVEIKHLTQFLQEAGDDLSFKKSDAKVTFQDPCRLGRHMGVFDEPRKLAARIPGMNLLEMSKNRERAVCCGTSAWLSCTQVSRTIQKKRLSDAKQTGAETLMTACPKCYIHFACTQSGKITEDENIKVEDIAVIAASHLQGKGKK